MYRHHQEEADTKMFLCAAYASQLGFNSVSIITVDSDVAILSLYFQSKLGVEIYLQMGTGFRKNIMKFGSNDLSQKFWMLSPQFMPYQVVILQVHSVGLERRNSTKW